MIVNGWVAVSADESVASMLTSNVPGTAGVPVIVPSGDRARPGGRGPDARDHVYGPVPPTAARGAEYGAPSVPEGRSVVVMHTDCGGTPSTSVFHPVKVLQVTAADDPASTCTPIPVSSGTSGSVRPI